MDTKHFITLAVGMVVGILLISGVVTPVIASLDSGGEETVHYNEVFVGDSSSYSYYYSTPENIGDTNIYMYYQDISFEDLEENPDAESWRGAPNYIILGAYWYIGYGYSHDEFSLYFVTGSEVEVILLESPLTLTGDTITATISDSDEMITLEGTKFIFCAESMATHSYGNNTLDEFPIYVGNAELWIETEDWMLEPEYATWGFGSADKDYSYGYWYDYEVSDSGILSNGKILTEDGYLVGATVSDGTESLTYDMRSSGDDYFLGVIYPLEVREGGAGGMDVPPTLLTVLSVIPLILTVGLVIGAIGCLRMKN